MEQSLLFAAKMSSILGEKGFLRERTIKSRLEKPAGSKTLKKQNVLKREFVLLCSTMRVDGFTDLNGKQMPKGRIMLLGKQNVEMLTLSIKFG